MRRSRRCRPGSERRRQGVARALARALIDAGFERTDVITCNARASPAAAPFWESMGFLPIDAAGITHTLRR